MTNARSIAHAHAVNGLSFDMRLVVPHGFDVKAPSRRLPVLFKVGLSVEHDTARNALESATRHTSHVARRTSHVTRHTSHVTRHTSHVSRAVLQVYGGPGSVLVTKSFRLSFDEWIASKGFAVITVDGRCAPYVKGFAVVTGIAEARAQRATAGAD